MKDSNQRKPPRLNSRCDNCMVEIVTQKLWLNYFMGKRQRISKFLGISEVNTTKLLEIYLIFTLCHPSAGRDLKYC